MSSSEQIKHAVQRQFGAAADRYAVAKVHISGADLECLVAAAELSGGEQLLDVGSGAGHSALAFARAGANVVGIDLTAQMVATARELADREELWNARFEQGDAECLPFERDQFDRVTCRLCAHHFADVPAALAEIRRVLRPGGRFLLEDSVAPEEDQRDRFFQEFETLRDPSHVRNYRVSEWNAMLRDAGLEPQPIGDWELQIDFDDWVARMHTPPDAVTALRRLADATPAPIRDSFRFSGQSGVFLIPIAAFAAR
jgi:ubiquinone/menaquinone biosynthesis C-methylase UbiE